MLVVSSAEREARRAAELAARSSYGRLVAVLTSQTNDLATAEDALSDAFSKALVAWTEKGIPESVSYTHLTLPTTSRV